MKTVVQVMFMVHADDTTVGNFLGGNVCKRHMKAGARDLEDRAQMVPDVTNRSQPNVAKKY